MADFVYEVAITGDRRRQNAVETWFDTFAAPAWRSLCTSIDAYTMIADGTHDPYVDDGVGPLLLAMLAFPTAEAMSQAIVAPSFVESLGEQPTDVIMTGTPFERRFYPVAGESRPGPLAAPFSYVVRYHRPAEDEAEFVAHYLADHPAILATLPRIRSVLCYLPLEALAGTLPTAGYMLGNEVAFDSPEAFNAAMASPVRHELRAHFRSFPKFSGRNTHFPMMRRRLVPASEGDSKRS